MLEFHHAFDLLSHKLIGWVQQFILLLPNLLIATVILVATFFALLLAQLRGAPAAPNEAG